MIEAVRRALEDDAVEFFDCPKCGVERGDDCEVSIVFGGRRITHKERSEVLRYWQRDGARARKAIKRDQRQARKRARMANTKGSSL
jgi:hypothetical protein